MRKKRTCPSKVPIVIKKETPYESLNIIKDFHIEKYGWSGCLIKALRINRNMTIKDLAERLRYRVCKLRSYEEEGRPIGIKLSKELGEIFHVDWHLFRDKNFVSTLKDKL